MKTVKQMHRRTERKTVRQMNRRTERKTDEQENRVKAKRQRINKRTSCLKARWRIYDVIYEIQYVRYEI